MSDEPPYDYREDTEPARESGYHMDSPRLYTHVDAMLYFVSLHASNRSLDYILRTAIARECCWYYSSQNILDIIALTYQTLTTKIPGDNL
jgi:hypothetical protein